MSYRDKGCTDHTAGEDKGCLCPSDQRPVDQEECDETPRAWILAYSDGDRLYCNTCKSEYWLGEDCECVIYRILRARGRGDIIRSWLRDQQ